MNHCEFFELINEIVDYPGIISFSYNTEYTRDDDRWMVTYELIAQCHGAPEILCCGEFNLHDDERLNKIIAKILYKYRLFLENKDK